jgi:uncharacterized membrane protein (UPF0127 family)
VKILPLVIGTLAVVLAGCNDPKQAVAAQSNAAVALPVFAPPYLTNAQPRLPIIKLFVGGEELSTELAVRQVEIYTGMMWRTNMPENEAMLFVFGNAQPRAFYMRNTRVPLSLAYISPDGVIQEIHDLQPLNETSVPSLAENIQYVLEVPQGWFKRHNISVGTLLSTSRGELRKSLPPPQVP